MFFVTFAWTEEPVQGDLSLGSAFSSDASFYGKDVPIRERMLSILLDIGLAIYTGY